MTKLITRVKGFNTRQSNAGANGMGLIIECVDHMFKHTDWTPLAWMLSGAEDRDKPRIRAIVGAVTGGVTVKKDPKQPTGLRFTLADNAGVSEKMPIARALVEEQVSFRSNQLSERGLLEAKNVEFDVKKYYKTFIAKLTKEGYTVEQFLNAGREV